jgi:ubiquinone/menaquinone biosynthesis C-methylase UbiE
MNPPINFRQSIPLFCNKTETQFQQDSYERFDPMVIRQTALHLADELWGHYPLQALLDFAEAYYPELENPKIVELGCSTGRWIATLAKTYPAAICWGLDYSYQMLKRAREYWVEDKSIYLDFTQQGFPSILELKGETLSNLHFGMAKAEELPFAADSQDLLLHSFLLDRLDEPLKALQEMYRILRPGGKMIFITPLNFQKKQHWEKLYPAIKLYQLLLQTGFTILDWQEDFRIREPLDARGNEIEWKCVGVVLEK